MFEIKDNKGYFYLLTFLFLCKGIAPLGIGEQISNNQNFVSGSQLFSVPLHFTITLTVPSHKSLTILLKKVGFSKDSVAHVAALVNQKYIRVGQKVSVSYEEGGNVITQLTVPLSIKTEIQVVRNSNGNYSQSKKENPVQTSLMRIQGKSSNNIFKDLVAKGVTYQVAISMVRALTAAGINWRHHIQAGMEFSILYKQLKNPKTSETVFQTLLYAKFKNKSKNYAVYQYCPSGKGMPKFYTSNGTLCTQEKFIKPVNHGRLSSRFGVRFHPVHHVYKMHKGIDFSAPSGTPVLSAGSGVIEKMGNKGTYGNYIRIKHSNGLKTAYAHLKCYAKSLRVGQQINQGQIIGYVGNTGCATGAHLHFEMLNSEHQHINPLQAVYNNKKLSGDQKKAFLSHVNYIQKMCSNASN